MDRRANKKRERAPRAIAPRFTPEERAILKVRTGIIGGLQGMENWLIDSINPRSGRCVIDPDHLMRLILYIKSYGSGGPQANIRAAVIPALARIGIIITLDWGEDGTNYAKENEEED